MEPASDSDLPDAPRRRRGRWPGGWLLVHVGVAVAVALTLRALVVPFADLQLLPLPALRAQPWTSLFYLHAQPPLLNAELALALWVERHSGVPLAALLAGVQLVLLLGTMQALLALADHLVDGRRGRTVAKVLLVGNPALYLVAFEWTYTLHEAFYLARAALAVQHWVARRRACDLAAACTWGVALTCTRALFHPLWLGLALAAVVGLARRGRGAPLARGERIVLASSALAVLVWPLKNLLVFGFFGSSSWFGYNLARDLPVAPPPEFAMFDSVPTPAAEAARRQASGTVPARFAQVAALTLVEKPGRAPNWNHYAMLQASAALGRAAFACILQQPGAFLERARTNYGEHYAYSTLRHPYTGRLPGGADASWMGPWMRAYEAVTCGRVFDDFNRRPLPPLAYLLPLALGLVLRQTLRRYDPARRATAAFLLVSVVWVLALVVAVDGAEANRMRISTEPLLVLSVAWACGSLRAERRLAPQPTQTVA